ncbi:NADH-quinone oxidoreductase subunit 2 [Streptomyces sp. AVP053U2]|nr:NADH-quinone oxidoreductase subunit 2 [Streptomyces sp. AVP053U2]
MCAWLHDEDMGPIRPAGRFDAFRALSDRSGRAGERLARTGEKSVGGPETWAPAVAAVLGLPAAAALGPAAYYADLAAPHGRRHVRVCAATACFAAQAGRHLTQVEQELGVTAAAASPDGETSLQAVRCLGYCYAGPAALDGTTPCTGPTLAAQLGGREPPTASRIPVTDDTGDPVLLPGVVAGEPAWQVWPRTVTAGSPDRVHSEVGGRLRAARTRGSGVPGVGEVGGVRPGARHRGGGQRRRGRSGSPRAGSTASPPDTPTPSPPAPSARSRRYA